MKKHLIIFTILFTSIVLFSCGSPSSRTSNVKKVMESRANPAGQAAPSAISNGSDMKRSASNQVAPQQVMKVDLDFDDNLYLTIILKDSYKNCIFNLGQGQIIYIEKGRINFHYLQDILINTIKNYYFIRNNEKLASKASIV